jgi:hypothetical protein
MINNTSLNLDPTFPPWVSNNINLSLINLEPRSTLRHISPAFRR